MPDPDTQKALNIIDAMYHLECAGISKEQREVIEAVVGGNEILGEAGGWVVLPEIVEYPKPTPVTKPCPECLGDGEVFPPPYPVTFHKGAARRCPTCHGTGKK